MNPTFLQQDASIVEPTTELTPPIPTRTVGRKATITKEELFQATLKLIGPQKVLRP